MLELGRCHSHLFIIFDREVNRLQKRLPVLLSMLLFVIILNASLTVFAAAPRTAAVNVNILNVRSGPGQQHGRISQVTRGNVLPVLAELSGWLQVSLGNGQSGWVATQHVTVRNNPVASRPAAESSAIVNVNILNVRSGAGTNFSRLTTALRGGILPLLSRQGNWLQVRLPDGQSGWVAAQHTTIRQNSGGEQNQTPNPVATTPPAPQAPVVTIPATPATPSTVAVNVPILNVRSGPDTTFDRIATISQGTSLPVLGRQGNWLQVGLASGQSGWVFATYTGTSLSQPPATAPSASPASPAVPTGRAVSVAVDGSTVWSGPGFETRQISTLPQGTSLTVINEQGDWLQVRLSSGELAWVASWLVTAGAADPQPTEQQQAVVSPLSGRIIVLDPGHGINPAHGNFSGAVGVTGLVEDELVLDVSLQAAELLRQAGATVVLTRAATTVALGERVAIAEQTRAHVFVSVHANAHLNRAISGTETFYFQGKPNDTENYWLAAHLQNELVRALGLRDLGVKHGNFLVIREATMPAALVELGFLSNAGDEALMRTAQFRANAARAIFLGLERFFQI